MIVAKKGSTPTLYHAYKAYNTDSNPPDRKSLSCGVVRQVNHIACPSILRYLGKAPVFTHVFSNNTYAIQPTPYDLGKRWCFGELDTTYDPRTIRYWKTFERVPVKGFIPVQITGGGCNIYVDPGMSSGDSSTNFWDETVQANSAITPSRGGWGILVQSPVSGGDGRIKRAFYTDNDGYNRGLSSVALAIGNMGVFTIAFYISVMLNLDIWMPSESDFYPGSENFDISLAGGYYTRTDNDWTGTVNPGSGSTVINNSCKYMPMDVSWPAKYRKSGSGTSADPTIVELLLRGYYILRYPVGSGFNPLKIPLPGFRLGPYSMFRAPGRQYIVRGYAMTIEAVYEPT